MRQAAVHTSEMNRVGSYYANMVNALHAREFVAMDRGGEDAISDLSIHPDRGVTKKSTWYSFDRGIEPFGR